MTREELERRIESTRRSLETANGEWALELEQNLVFYERQLAWLPAIVVDDPYTGSLQEKLDEEARWGDGPDYEPEEEE